MREEPKISILWKFFKELNSVNVKETVANAQHLIKAYLA